MLADEYPESLRQALPPPCPTRKSVKARQACRARVTHPPTRTTARLEDQTEAPGLFIAASSVA